MMLLFEESFADPEKLTRDWIVGPGMAVRDGLLSFCPGHHEGFCVGMTRRDDFGDFSMTADVRIVYGAVGLVLRAAGPGQYYMVQFDLANNPSVIWFHTFTPSARQGFRVDLVPSAVVPRSGVWSRMRIIARENAFQVLLGELGGPLKPCASWRDSEQTYRQGAVGVWEHGGEAGEYRALRVDALDGQA